MVDYQEARTRMLQYLAELNTENRKIAESRKSLSPQERQVLGFGFPEDDVVEADLVEDETMHIEGGWVFFYQSKKFLETGDCNDAFAGNAPVIVSTSDGAFHVTGTAHPIEVYIESFLRCGNPLGDAVTR